MSIINYENSTSSCWGSSLWNETRNLLHIGARATGYVISDLLLGRALRPIMTHNSLCMENLLPSNSLATINKINHVLLKPRNFLSNLFHLNETQITKAVAPVLEEFQFRYLLQQVALRDVPQTLLNKFSQTKTSTWMPFQ